MELTPPRLPVDVVLVPVEVRLLPFAAIALAGFGRAITHERCTAPAGYDQLVDLFEHAATSGQSCREGCARVQDHQVPLTLSITDVAAVLGLSTRTVRRRLADGTIASTLVGRRRLIHRDAVIAILAAS